MDRSLFRSNEQWSFTEIKTRCRGGSEERINISRRRINCRGVLITDCSRRRSWRRRIDRETKWSLADNMREYEDILKNSNQDRVESLSNLERQHKPREQVCSWPSSSVSLYHPLQLKWKMIHLAHWHQPAIEHPKHTRYAWLQRKRKKKESHVSDSHLEKTDHKMKDSIYLEDRHCETARTAWQEVGSRQQQCFHRTSPTRSETDQWDGNQHTECLKKMNARNDGLKIDRERESRKNRKNRTNQQADSKSSEGKWDSLQNSSRASQCLQLRNCKFQSWQQRDQSSEDSS